MAEEPRILTMEINHRQAWFPEGATVHRAAELNGIYIPSLCSHKDLSPFGGCRLCMVEVDGVRGYPLSCNMRAEAGMKVLTDTTALAELRAEILKLILSEHPSSCLFCGEKNECRDYQGTIRKAGVTTGCRFCPNDAQCELQDLVEKIGVSETDYPIYYHGYEPEHDDPFYDRDYNICILCGRCVRMCQEVRGTAVLAFNYRGPRATIGPAFGRSHVEAGCEFCGACVDVCPTGALADKVSKWDGKPDGSTVSTCPFCAIGCQLELAYRGGRLSKAKANQDPEVNDGQLCVKGRFCLPETTHHFSRARRPMLRKGAYFREVTWAEALESAAARIAAVPPEDFLMLASPDLTNESLFAAQKLARGVIGSSGIDSTARLELPGGLAAWSKLFSLPISLKGIARADAILAVGVDSRFNFSVIGTKIRKALDRGASLVTIDPRDSNLARYTDDWIRPAPGAEGILLAFIADRLAGGRASAAAPAKAAGVESAELERAIEVLSGGRELAVVVGPQVFRHGDALEIAESLMRLSTRPDTNVVPLYFGANVRGALEMGVFPEIAPGDATATGSSVAKGAGAAPGRGEGLSLADVTSGSKRPKVLYLAGDVPFRERPACDFLIVQDTYLPPFDVDVFLPAATFAEAGGTLVNLEGRVQEIARVENPPEGAVTGFVRPDWRIFADLAEALGRPGMKYTTVEDVFEDIRGAVPAFPSRADRVPRRMRPLDLPAAAPRSAAKGASKGAGDFLLVAEPGGYRHRGIDISSKVGGLGELALEEGFRMNPEDIAAIGLADGDEIAVTVEGGAAVAAGRIRSNAECPKGVMYYTRPVVFGGLAHRRALWPLYALEANPLRASVSKAPADASNAPPGKP